jgi:hypothetical protein
MSTKSLLLILLFATNLCFAQTDNSCIVTDTPLFRRKTTVNCEIVRIDKCKFSTKVYFKYTSPIIDGWANIEGGIYIRDTNTKNIFRLKNVNNIPLAPAMHNFNKAGETLYFNLEFEPLDTWVDNIDIVENDMGEDGFNFYGVSLKVGNRDWTRIVINEDVDYSKVDISAQDEFVYIGMDADKTKVYVKKEKTEGNETEIWVKSVKPTKKIKNKKGKMVTIGGGYTMIFMNFNCENKEYNTTFTYEYSSSGKLIRHMNIYDGYNKVVPGTLGVSIYEYLCQ